MRRASIRTRLLIATALPPVALVVTYVVGVPMWSLYIEDRIFINIVSAQLADAEIARSEGRDLDVPLHGERVFRGPGALPVALLGQLESKGPGIHELLEVEIDGRTTDAFVGIGEGDDPSERLYVLLDVGALEALRTKAPVAIILFLIAGVSAVMLLTGIAISRSLFQSVRSLSSLSRSPAGDRAVVLPDDELGALGRGWLAARQELEFSASRQRRFARNVSHELRTPIAVASGALELLRKHKPQMESREHELLSRADTALREMRELIDVFMGVAEGAAAGPDARSTIRAAVSQAVAEIASADEVLAERMQLSIDPDEDASEAELPKAPLSIVVRHLVMNAARHAPPGSPIEIRASHGAISVSNPVDHEAASRPARQSGVGLRILLELVDSVGWSIDATKGDSEFVATVTCQTRNTP